MPVAEAALAALADCPGAAPAQLRRGCCYLLLLSLRLMLLQWLQLWRLLIAALRCLAQGKAHACCRCLKCCCFVAGCCRHCCACPCIQVDSKRHSKQGLARPHLPCSKVEIMLLC